jgi:hypothetical protein
MSPLAQASMIMTSETFISSVRAAWLLLLVLLDGVLVVVVEWRSTARNSASISLKSSVACTVVASSTLCLPFLLFFLPLSV